jgi:ribosomal protein S18 acetylase RimI-like enzyme
MDGDTWHRYRLNVGPYDHAPFSMEPYNPPYYASLWTENHFSIVQEYYSQHIADFTPLADRLSKLIPRCERDGYSFRPLDLDQFATELDTLFELSTTIFRDNLLYSNISREDFHELYLPAKPYIRPDLVYFAFTSDGTAVGFIFALPENQHTLNLKTIGVIPDYRGKALAGALMALVYRAAFAHGFSSSNHCLIKAGNISGSLDGGHGVISRNYHLYEYCPTP